MRKICIICPWGFPIPAVKGGAVETLMQFLIEENESEPHFQFTLLTTYDETAERLAKQYKYTEYVGFKGNPYLDKPWDFCFRAVKKVFHTYLPCTPRMFRVIDYVKGNRHQFDYILLECGSSYMLPCLAKVFPKERILAHLHWTGDGNKKLDDNAGHVLAASDFIAKEWQRRTSCSDDKLYVLPNCCNDEAFSKDLNDKEIRDLKDKLGIKDEKVIIFVGRIIEGKGILDLIKALQNVSVKDVVLLVIGRANFGQGTITEFEKEIDTQIKKSKVKIIHSGFVKNEELYQYYSISDLFVNPTKLEEAAGMVNVEAMMTGTPIITTNKGGIKEYVADAGILLEVDDCFVNNLTAEIDRLLSNEDLLEQYGAKAKLQGERFTGKKYYRQFVEIMDEIDRTQ